MAHYICTGTCKGGADKPGACEDEHCSKHGEPLEECECVDAQHNGRQGDVVAEPPEETPSS